MAQSGPRNLELGKCTWLYSGNTGKCILHEYWITPAGGSNIMTFLVVNIAIVC